MNRFIILISVVGVILMGSSALAKNFTYDNNFFYLYNKVKVCPSWGCGKSTARPIVKPFH